MTEKRIYKLKPEIEKKVYEKFPISKAEKKCKIEKANMEGLRWRLAQRLFEEIGKPEIQIKDFKQGGMVTETSILVNDKEGIEVVQPLSLLKTTLEKK